MTKHLLIVTLVISMPSLAEVYKCVGPDGKVTFSNNPYCSHKQEYAKERNVELHEVNFKEASPIPPEKEIELYFSIIELPNLLEDIGKFAEIPLEPIGLDGISIDKHPDFYPWLQLLENTASVFNLEFRKAYNRIYTYQSGSMGETIVNSPDLLRWYQKDKTWNIVLQQDDILLRQKAYEDTTLPERLPRLIKRVRREIGEQVHLNAGETVVIKKNATAGVSGDIVSRGSNQILDNDATKRRQIIQRRVSNSSK